MVCDCDISLHQYKRNNSYIFQFLLNASLQQSKQRQKVKFKKLKLYNLFKKATQPYPISLTFPNKFKQITKMINIKTKLAKSTEKLAICITV